MRSRHGCDGNQSIAEGVVDHYSPLSQAFGSARADVIRMQDLQHAASHETDGDPEARVRAHLPAERCAGRCDESRPVTCEKAVHQVEPRDCGRGRDVRADTSDRRQPPKPPEEDDLRHQSKPECRHPHAQNCQQPHQYIRPPAGSDRRNQRPRARQAARTWRLPPGPVRAWRERTPSGR